MKSEEEIRRKLDELERKSWEAVKDSWTKGKMGKVNRGAVYGQAEALKWVLDKED